MHKEICPLLHKSSYYLKWSEIEKYLAVWQHWLRKTVHFEDTIDTRQLKLQCLIKDTEKITEKDGGVWLHLVGASPEAAGGGLQLKLL